MSEVFFKESPLISPIDHLLIRALIFRQDYRINRMMVRKIENHVDPACPVRKYFGFMSK